MILSVKPSWFFVIIGVIGRGVLEHCLLEPNYDYKFKWPAASAEDISIMFPSPATWFLNPDSSFFPGDP